MSDAMTWDDVERARQPLEMISAIAGTPPNEDDEQSEIDTSNDHMVGIRSGGIVFSYPPTHWPMTRDESLRMAAWIVVLADPEGERFQAILDAIQNT